jgi:hypothetical protein
MRLVLKSLHQEVASTLRELARGQRSRVAS